MNDYWAIGKQVARFTVIIAKDDVRDKMSPVEPEVLADRLRRANQAADIIQRYWKLWILRANRKKQRNLRKLGKILLVAKLRGKVELSIAQKYDKFIKLRSYFLKKKDTRMTLDRIEMASKIIKNVVHKGFVRRAGFAMYMIRDYRDPLFPSMIQARKYSENDIKSKDHRDMSLRKYLSPKYVDSFHALIFKNFKVIGRREGNDIMADRYRSFITTAKVFYAIIKMHNDEFTK